VAGFYTLLGMPYFLDTWKNIALTLLAILALIGAVILAIY